MAQTKLKLSGHWPEWMDGTEARICNKLITAILSHGCRIGVRDGEEGETMCESTVNRADVQKNTAQTGITLYDVYADTRWCEGQELNPAAWVRAGSFTLIHSNGEDVVSDMAWKNEWEDLMHKIDRMAQGE